MPQFQSGREPKSLKSSPQLVPFLELCATSGRMTHARTSLPRMEAVPARPTLTLRLLKRSLTACVTLVIFIAVWPTTAASTSAPRIFSPPMMGQSLGSCSRAPTEELP